MWEARTTMSNPSRRAVRPPGRVIRAEAAKSERIAGAAR